MPLRSELFRGDAKLELALTNDSGHIVPGARGEHVEKIQFALMVLDSATIATSELTSDVYGATTADAVLAYKRKRAIINRSYQSTADNIVGKMTMAALDDEMCRLYCMPKWSGCNYYPTHRYPNLPMFIAVASAAAAPAPLSPLGTALAEVPTAIGMRNKAKEAVNQVIDGETTPLANLGREALARHYKVSAPAEMDRVAREVRGSLAGVVSRLLSARAWLRSGDGGGFAETPTPRDGHSYILRNYPSAGRLLRPTILIHEAFHDLSDFNQDFGGNPAVDQGAKYHQNNTAIQLRNAYAMSRFVLHIHVGAERFLNDND